MKNENTVTTEYDWLVGGLVRVQCSEDNPGTVPRELWGELGLVVGVHRENSSWYNRKTLVVMMCRDPNGVELRHFHPMDVQLVSLDNDPKA